MEWSACWASMHDVAISLQCWRVHLLRNKGISSSGNHPMHLENRCTGLCNSGQLWIAARLQAQRCAASRIRSAQVKRTQRFPIRSDRLVIIDFMMTNLSILDVVYVMCSVRLDRKHDLFGLSWNPWCLSLLSAVFMWCGEGSPSSSDTAEGNDIWLDQ